jgi:peptide/nickel transport system substrate-binding protein
MDKLIEAAAVEMDEAKRRALLEEANALAAKDRPFIPLASVESAWTLRKDKAQLLRTRIDEDSLAMDVAPAK